MSDLKQHGFTGRGLSGSRLSRGGMDGSDDGGPEPAPKGVILTEDGNFLTTEDGNRLQLE